MRNKIIKVIEDFIKQQKLNIRLNKESFLIEFKKMGIDSISVLGLIVSIEKKLNIRLDDSELSKIKTINQLILAFEKKCK